MVASTVSPSDEGPSWPNGDKELLPLLMISKPSEVPSAPNEPTSKGPSESEDCSHRMLEF